MLRSSIFSLLRVEYFSEQEKNCPVILTKVQGQGVKPKESTEVWHECRHPCITPPSTITTPTPLNLSPSPWNHSSVRASFRSTERKAEISFSGRLVAVLPLEEACGLWPVDGAGDQGKGRIYFFRDIFSLPLGGLTWSRERPCGRCRDPVETLKTHTLRGTYPWWPLLTLRCLSQQD